MNIYLLLGGSIVTLLTTIGAIILWLEYKFPDTCLTGIPFT
jgi:hypothetical protein